MIKSLQRFFYLTVIILVSACSAKESDKTDAEVEKAPDFEVTTIKGEIISLQSSLDEDKPVVIYFTAS